MISVKRLCDSTGKQFYLVESRLPDGKLQCITRSFKLRCNARGFEDVDTRAKALRFAITTDSLVQFRAFIFSEQDASGGHGRIEGSVSLVSPRLESFLPLESSPGSGKRRGIRSYICMRQNRLTGLRFVVAMSRLDNGRLRAVSFQDHSLVGGGVPDEAYEALNKAVRFLRGVAFESWRKQNLNDLMSRDRETVGHRRERALKHISAFVEFDSGEKVDCACGKNRSRGLMMACERCGAWEHAECQGFRSDKQIPADYICSACMRADREDVVVIRLDEQGECGNLQLEDLWTDAKIRDREGDDPVCCVCGCEDNQDFEAMVHPVTEHACDDGAAWAHPACVSAAQHLSHKMWTSKAVQAGLCQICGDRFLLSPKDEHFTSSGVSSAKTSKGSTSPSSQTRNSRRSAKTDQTSRKRLRSALTNGAVAKVEVAEKRPVKNVKEESDGHPSQSGDKTDSPGMESNKIGTTTSLGRRFSGAAVTVPIKKRRIQISEVPRSPSPPPRSPSPSPSPSPQFEAVIPKGETLDQTGPSFKGEVGQGSEDAEMQEGGAVEHETVVVAGAHNFGVSESKDVGGQIPIDGNLYYPVLDTVNLVARQESYLTVGASDVGGLEKGVGSTTKVSESSLRRLTATHSRLGTDVGDTARGSEADPSGFNRLGQLDDHLHGKGRLKSIDRTKLSENGRPQHDNLPLLHGHLRLLEGTQYEGLLGSSGRPLTLSEGKEVVMQPLAHVSSKLPSAGSISPDIHQSVSGNASTKHRTLVSAVDAREFHGRQSLNDASRNIDLAENSDPVHGVDDEEAKPLSADKCEKEVSTERDGHYENFQSGDAEVKDVARSSSASQGPSRDARLHWDLNMDMEEWERPPEEDTGTFAGVGSVLASSANHLHDPNDDRDQRVTAHDVKLSVPPAESEPELVAEIVLEELSTEADAAKISPSEGECDVSSNDAGGAGLKFSEETEAIDSVNDDVLPVMGLDLQTSSQSRVTADRVDGESNSAQQAMKVGEGSPKVEDQAYTVFKEKRIPPIDEEKGTDVESQEVGPSKNASEDVKGYTVAEMDVEEESKVGVIITTELVPLPEGQSSASTTANDLGGTSSSDADFPGKPEVTRTKMTPEERLLVTGKSVDESGDTETNAISADNYDFVEYDASDDEEERAAEVEKVMPEKSAGEPLIPDFPRAESPREWNEDPVEMEAEHVDYDDSGDSRDGDERGSEVDERTDGEWTGAAATGQPDVQELEEVEKSAEPSLEGAETVDEVENLQVDVVKEGSTVPEAADCQISETKSITEDTNVELRDFGDDVDRQGDGSAVKRDDSDTKSPEKVDSVMKLREIIRSQEEKEPSTQGSGPSRRGEGQSRTKSSGWDQLPEGFDNPDDALRAAKGNPVIRTGRGSPWGGTNGRGASISPRGGPVTSRFGRGLRNDSMGDRARSEDSWTRDDHQHGIRGDDSLDISPRLASPRELGRGRSHGRGGSPVVRARGRMEPWMDSPSGPTSPWGPNRHPSPPGRYNDGVGFGPRGPTNAAAVAAAKVESSGFVVAPDGTVTKAGSSSRGPPRPFQSGGRSGRGVIFNMGRGGPGMGMGVGMNLGGLRVNMGMGRGMGMGPGMGMNMGIGMGIGMGVGPGLGLGLPGRGGPGGRGIVDRYTAPYAGRGSSPLVENSSSSRRGRSHEEYPDNWSRREERSASPRKRRSASRRSRSRTLSRSRSRTRSPRVRTPPRPTNSSGSGGGNVDKSNKKRSHSPVAHKPEQKTERPESPPARRSVPPPPKLPLPPPPPRSQRSPPAGLKRLSDSKRDGDRARSRDRERDRERERPATRARTPPRRTSPHVVHGSALMDDRDRQLLAGIRHVSPAGARHRSTENTGAAAAAVAASSRDSPPTTSPLGRVAEGNSEGRRQSGDEGGESRVHGPRREETGPKVEQRSSKDSSRGERERTSRRDGGRDRDEERRDVSKMSYSRDRDGRGSSSMKYNREGDDDVAPRRRRPSP